MKIGSVIENQARAYIAAYPCLQNANSAAFSFGGAGIAALTAGDVFWYYLGCPVKFRTPSGSTGLATDTLYYLRRISAGSYMLHNSFVGALTNSDTASLTSNGGGTNYIFPAFVTDISGSNNAIFNTKLTDQNAFTVAKYIGSSSESGTQAQNFYIQPSALASKYNPASGALFISLKIKAPTPSVNKRSLFGNGGLGQSNPGFAVYSDAADPTRLRIGVSNASTTLTSAASSAAALDATEHTVALLIDSAAGIATLFIDGVEDVSLLLTIPVEITNPVCFGGNGGSALACSLRFIHVFGFVGSAPVKTKAVAKHLALNYSKMLNDGNII